MLRDRLRVDEAAAGRATSASASRVFYEGWHPSRAPQTYRDRDTSLSRLAEAAQLGGPDETAVAAESATKALADHVSAGAFDDALNVLPSAVHGVLKPAIRS